MNMASYEGRLVHQITADIEVPNLEHLCRLMNRDEFIYGRQWYKRKNEMTGESYWQDRGDIIINTAHIGRISEFIEKEEDYDESQGRTNFSRQYPAGPRGPLRQRRYDV
jgi:hypothetical protein